jgi:hypothetical protein
MFVFSFLLEIMLAARIQGLRDHMLNGGDGAVVGELAVRLELLSISISNIREKARSFPSPICGLRLECLCRIPLIGSSNAVVFF